MVTFSTLREKASLLQAQLFIFQEENQDFLVGERKDVFKSIQNTSDELTHLLIDRTDRTKLFPYSSARQKIFIALFHTTVILLIALLYQIYDNHKVYRDYMNEVRLPHRHAQVDNVK